MSQAVGSNVDGTFGNFDWTKLNQGKLFVEKNTISLKMIL